MQPSPNSYTKTPTDVNVPKHETTLCAPHTTHRQWTIQTKHTCVSVCNALNAICSRAFLAPPNNTDNNHCHRQCRVSTVISLCHFLWEPTKHTPKCHMKAPTKNKTINFVCIPINRLVDRITRILEKKNLNSNFHIEKFVRWFVTT